ncbi:MAG: zinc-ribbon domain-containing protein [Ruminiclostridium sp.]|nr:zinc-ribbon domain-containing protein [Ruminiclostridium sp.]
MPFCSKCGTEYQEGTKFCGKCGENVDGSVAAAKPAKQGPTFFEKILNTKDYTAQMDAEDIKQNKVMAILAFCAIFAYIVFNWSGIGLLGVVAFAGLMVAPCLAYKKSEFVRFQMSQLYVAFFGVLLFAVLDGAIAGLIYSIMVPAENVLVLNLGLANAGIVTMHIIATILAWLVHLVIMAIPIFTLVVGFIDVIKDKAKAMPFIGKIKVTFEK